MRRRTPVLLTLVPAVVAGLLAVPAVADAATGPSVPSSFSFSGAGWGHGVGMSQVGARGQATEGRSASQILRHYFTGSSVASYRDDVNLRVNTQYLRSKVRVRVEPLTSATARAVAVVGGKKVALGSKDVLEVAVTATGTTVRKNGAVVATTSPVTIHWSGTRDAAGTGTAPAVLNVVASGSLDTSGHRYRAGTFEVRGAYSTAANRRAVTAVNVVKLHDEYLNGVAEMPSSWPAAALQAQVIAARSYALVKYRAGVRTGCWCHVFDDTSDLVYVGNAKAAGSMGNRWTAAVRATNVSSTSSQTLLVKGRPAQAFFFSSSGGRTQNSEDVWGSKLSYLRSVDDHWSRDRRYNPSYSSWGPAVRSQSTVARAFGLPDVARVEIAGRTAGGAVRQVRAVSSKGSVGVLAGPTAVARLSLTSRWFSLTGAPAPAPAPAPVTSFTVAPYSTAVQSVAGSPARIRGVVKPVSRAAGAKVVLQRVDPRSGSWVNVATGKVSRSGAYSFDRVSKKAVVEKYRVYKSKGTCGSGCTLKADATPIVLVAFADRWSVKASTKAATKAGSRPVVTGAVVPASKARSVAVSLQRWDPRTRTWVSAGTGRTNSRGVFTVSGRSVPAGSHRYAVVVPRTKCTSKVCLLPSIRSAAVNVRVVQPFVVGAKGKGTKGVVVMRGSVSPAAAAAGSTVRIAVRQGSGWRTVASATVGSDGRYAKTMRGFTVLKVSFRVSIGAAGCSNGVCTYGADSAFTKVRTR